MKDIRHRLLATFQIEHRDHVEQIRSLLAMIEKTAGPPQGADLDEVFRRAHSLKGAARAVDLQPVEGLAHRLETLFSRVRQGLLPLDKSVTGAVQLALDASEDCVMALGDRRPTPGFPQALQALERILGTEGKPAAAATRAPAGETKTETPVPAFQPLDMVRITSANFDGLLRSAGGLLSEGQRQHQLTAQMHGLAEQIMGMETELERARSQLAAPGFSRMRSYLDATRRQTRKLAGQARAVRHLHQRSSWNVSHLGKQLQLDVWQARMVPADSLLEGYRKMMRDLARDEEKGIEFRATSTGVNADRRVLEALKDPLLHLLRNAVSHGIERPEERLAQGKPPAGMVSLHIGSVGQLLSIAIEDDGRGVDFARAAKVAAGQGILSESEAAVCSPQQLTGILFRAGFSTAPAVTDLAGRGMGLSVVQETIRRLHGSVELRPREGGGTSIRLSVPLSISTQKFLLASCGGQAFAIPIHMIERLHRIRLDSISTIEGKPVTLLDREAVPVVSLQQLLGLDPLGLSVQGASASPGVPQNFSQAGTLPVAVLRLKNGKAAMAVDAFLGETDAVIQDLGSAARDGIAGGILLEDGKIAMVVHPQELADASTAHPHAFLNPAKIRQDRAHQQRGRFILVVDDSITTRTLEKSILEAHGYRVQVAVDGLDALAWLAKEKAELVITDVQMPRMDGFGLLAAMKADPALHKIPVIVVTSLDQREDQERGLELGADAYIVKRKFDQVELLAAIRQIL